MSASGELSNRRIVPRWRSFQDAIAVGELAPSIPCLSKGVPGEEFIRQKERDWLENRELGFATDLVCAAHVLGTTSVAKEAAEFVLERADKASSLSVDLARQLLGFQEIVWASASEPQNYRTGVYQRIRQLKKRRIDEPRNAFVWADLARLYVLLGLSDPAEKSIRTALALAPFDRFIVRVATRFFLHSSDPDRALRLLRRNERTKLDPWLMAAELAVSSVVEKVPKFGALAKQFLASKDVPSFHCSELASALGSIEMWSGNDRKACKLFVQSLVMPTENALAQGVWASKTLGLAPIDEKHFKLTNAFEAHTLSTFMHENWEHSFEFCKQWANDEAFSARPYVFGSSLASSLVDRYEEAETLAAEGLLTNPGHFGLLNNIAFAQIEQGKVPEAANTLVGINPETCSTQTARVCLMATQGLICYRSGQPSVGAELYRKAIFEAVKLKLFDFKARAMLYFAREKSIYNDPDADQLFELGYQEAVKLSRSDLIWLAKKIRGQILEQKLKRKANGRLGD
jgi:tetratricopeptide (TPR) repeat protein